MELRGKKVTVFGLARSGVGAANLLTYMGAEVTVTDRKSEEDLRDVLPRLSPLVRRALGGHPDVVVISSDMLVISPGVPVEAAPIALAKANGIPVIGELELACSIAGSLLKKEGAAAAFLAVTGSNGKSTTTTLLDFMLRKGGMKTLLAGNIGNALTEEIYQRIADRKGTDSLSDAWDRIVLEVSSFQLETVDRFRPHIASILNITPDHMDRYHSLGAYRSAKVRIAENQDETDYLVLNADDPETELIEKEILGRKGRRPGIYYFSRTKRVKGVYWRNGQVCANMPHLSGLAPDTPFIHDCEITIKGVHNLENAMAASAMALLAYCPVAAVIESLREFSGLEHRLELVREVGGVKYINDSKGTNVGAVLKSLESFSEPLILIAGGRDKAGDFSALGDLVAKKVKTLVLIGEASEKIGKALGGLTDTVRARDLQDAVRISRAKAARGDVVLLSPACASFDMFRDFEDRGRQFKKAVMEIAG